MGFLIDTNLWITIERGDLQISDIHALTRQAPIFLSPVNVAEMSFGIEWIDDPTQKQKAMDTMRRILRKPLIRITAGTGRIFGRIAAQLARQGHGSRHRVQDIWLAAQALERDLTILTANIKDFRDIPHLKVLELPIPKRSL